MKKHRILCGWLVLCLLASLLAGALAGSSVGSTSSSITPSAVKTYVRLTKPVAFFTGDVYGDGTMVICPSGEVCQLVSEDFYTPSDGMIYYSVYYNSKRYNVLRSDVFSDILTQTALEQYITETIWTSGSYSTLKQSMNLVGDIRVHALQMALKKLGYYSGNLDGSYGAGTADAVKAFQKANGLSADGSAGVLTQPVIYAMASGSSTAAIDTGSTTTTTTTTPTVSGAGTLTTNVSVNMRKKASKSSTLLTVVPAMTTLPYSSTTVASGVTWYQVTYNNRTGWLMGTYVTAGGSSGGGSSSGESAMGTLRTTSSVNLRKSATTSSARLASIPASVNLAFTDTSVKSGITWYYVTYNKIKGWVMGTFVKVTSSSGGGSSTAEAIGQVKITKSSTRVRKSPGGDKTGYVLALNSVVDLIAQPVTQDGYTWYNIRTASGLCGFVRGDCAQLVSSGGGSGSVIVDGSNKFAMLQSPLYVFTTDTMPSTGYLTLPAGTVVKLYSTQTYTVNGTQYLKIYYNSKVYNCLYSSISSDIMSDSELTSYINQLYASTLPSALKESLKLSGDVRVYALQLALKELGYYTGTLDGNFGSGTTTAVKNFQRSNKLTVDGSCGAKTWEKLTALLSGGGGSTVVTDFGKITKVVKASWDYNDNGGKLFPKGSYATVMDVETGKVFKIYRWSGGNHADCVPATSNDTKTMCDIVGFPYNSNHPTSAQLEKIKADGDKSTVTYTWPDYKAAFGGTAKNIGSKWDRRSALLNVDGVVYCVSIYGFPHGFNGTDSFSKSKFPDGTLFYKQNNFYGMICIHFLGSKTHSGSGIDSAHQNNIDKAYNYAKSKWPNLCQ